MTDSTKQPMTFEEFAIEHGMSILKVGNAYSDDDTNYAHWIWNKATANQSVIVAELVEALERSTACISDAVRIESSSFDEPPSPVSEWDWNADNLVCETLALLAKVKGK